MQRRDLLKKLGTASAATAAFSGAASASLSEGPDLDVEVDVSDVAGDVTLASLLDDAQLAQLSDDVDPSRLGVTIAPETETINPAACCAVCKYRYDPDRCHCSCCAWECCGVEC